MHIILSDIAVTIAAVWLISRCFTLLRIPVSALVRLLGIDIPTPPSVTLDSVGFDSVTLHWPLPEKAASIAKHIIQVNGVNVAESDRKDTSVTLSGINSGTIYTVRVLAVNHNNYHSASSVVKFRTRRRWNEPNDDSQDGHELSVQANKMEFYNQTSDQQQQQLQQTQQQQQQPKRHGKRTEPRRTTSGSSATVAAKPAGITAGTDSNAANQAYTIEGLRNDLEQLRGEIAEGELSKQSIIQEHEQAEAVLRVEVDQIQAKKRTEDNARLQIKTETKSLEEKKRSLEGQKLRLDKSKRALLEEIVKLQDEMGKWEEKQTEASERRNETKRLIAGMNMSKLEDEDKAKVDSLTAEIASVEEVIRTLGQSIKELDTQSIEALANIDLAFRQTLQRETGMDESLDTSWRETEKMLEERYRLATELVRQKNEEYQQAMVAINETQSRGSLALANNNLHGHIVRPSGPTSSPLSLTSQGLPPSSAAPIGHSTSSTSLLNRSSPIGRFGNRQEVIPSVSRFKSMNVSGNSRTSSSSSSSISKIPQTSPVGQNYFNPTSDSTGGPGTEEYSNFGPSHHAMRLPVNLLPSNLFASEEAPSTVPGEMTSGLLSPSPKADESVGGAGTPFSSSPLASSGSLDYLHHHGGIETSPAFYYGDGTGIDMAGAATTAGVGAGGLSPIQGVTSGTNGRAVSPSSAATRLSVFDSMASGGGSSTNSTTAASGAAATTAAVTPTSKRFSSLFSTLSAGRRSKETAGGTARHSDERTRATEGNKSNGSNPPVSESNNGFGPVGGLFRSDSRNPSNKALGPIGTRPPGRSESEDDRINTTSHIQQQRTSEDVRRSLETSHQQYHESLYSRGNPLLPHSPYENNIPFEWPVPEDYLDGNTDNSNTTTNNNNNNDAADDPDPDPPIPPHPHHSTSHANNSPSSLWKRRKSFISGGLKLNSKSHKQQQGAIGTGAGAGSNSPQRGPSTNHSLDSMSISEPVTSNEEDQSGYEMQQQQQQQQPHHSRGESIFHKSMRSFSSSTGKRSLVNGDQHQHQHQLPPPLPQPILGQNSADVSAQTTAPPSPSPPNKGFNMLSISSWKHRSAQAKPSSDKLRLSSIANSSTTDEECQDES